MTSHPTPSRPAPLTVGMLLYPNFTLLDLAGPQSALGFHSKTLLFWKTLEPVAADSGISLNPTHTFADARETLDVLFVPGGVGSNAAMEDPEILEFLSRVGTRSRYVTSVCSGSLLLGMAGLLDGYRAATHWAAYETLVAMGVTPGHERVVADRNRFTGGGVTAGIDFGLTLLAELRGQEVAKVTQLLMEYDPHPPFNTGHPRVAGEALTRAALAAMGEDFFREGVEIAKRRAVRSAVA
jgi:cyclohexyl-isocyanide hydratase